jgi:hypothetical protein
VAFTVQRSPQVHRKFQHVYYFTKMYAERWLGSVICVKGKSHDEIYKVVNSCENA